MPPGRAGRFRAAGRNMNPRHKPDGARPCARHAPEPGSPSGPSQRAPNRQFRLPLVPDPMHPAGRQVLEVARPHVGDGGAGSSPRGPERQASRLRARVRRRRVADPSAWSTAPTRRTPRAATPGAVGGNKEIVWRPSRPQILEAGRGPMTLQRPHTTPPRPPWPAALGEGPQIRRRQRPVLPRRDPLRQFGEWLSEPSWSET